VHERPINGLGPGFPSVFRHYGGYHVYKLGKAGYFYPVGMLEQGNEQAAHRKSVLKGVGVLQQRRGDKPLFHSYPSSLLWYHTFHSSKKAHGFTERLIAFIYSLWLRRIL
jgi:hypothetical protein